MKTLNQGMDAAKNAELKKAGIAREFHQIAPLNVGTGLLLGKRNVMIKIKLMMIFAQIHA